VSEELEKQIGKRVVVIGAGGNIGSHLVAHLARMPAIRRLTLIDKDVYETSNLDSQEITRAHVGMPKVRVLAKRLKRINSSLAVIPIFARVEVVPLGRMRADIILSCLDSRIARQHVNEYSWRLGVPLIDAGVQPAGLLARVNVYLPGRGNACLECAWDERDYAALEQAYPCLNGSPRIAATNAPSSLGSLAAALQAIECAKLLAGPTDAAAGRQVLIDALHHKHYVTAFRRNVNCRFGEHETWRIKKLAVSPNQMTLREALGLAEASKRDGASPGLSIENKPFAARLTCPDCQSTRRLLHLESRLSAARRRCRRCGSQMLAAGFDLTDRLIAGRLSPRELDRTLAAIGLRPLDVFTVETDRSQLHFELGGALSDSDDMFRGKDVTKCAE